MKNNDSGALSPIYVIYNCPIDGNRTHVIEQILKRTNTKGGCLVSINIEDESLLRSSTHLRRFVAKNILSIPSSQTYSITGNSLFFHNINSNGDFAEKLTLAFARSQVMFVIIFGAKEIRQVQVDWQSIYSGKRIQAEDVLKPAESAVFRSNLRSQDVFELCFMRLPVADLN